MRSSETLVGYRTFGEVNDSEDRDRTMIDAIPAMAWSSLPNGSVEFANRRWHDYTGLSAEELRGWDGRSPFILMIWRRDRQVASAARLGTARGNRGACEAFRRRISMVPLPR